MTAKFFSLLLFLLLLQESYAQTREAIGAPINTREHAEFAPTVSADGKTLLFESDRGKGWRLYISKNIAGKWSEPEDLAAINNAVGPDDFLGGPFLSYDGKTLFFTSNMAGTIGGIDIWYSENINGKWTKPVNLGPTINTKGYDGFPSLAPDGKTLYFMRAANKKMPGGQQCCEIFSAKKQGKFFIDPKPLPDPINTGCEGYPRIMADGTTLVFSSYRPEGKGGYDLYQSRFKYGRWSEPVPLEFMNTAGEDELVSVPASGDILYFGGQSNGKEDIFRIIIPAHLQPDQVVTLEGSVKDENNKPLSAQISINSMRTGQKLTTADNDKESGEFKVILAPGEKYDIAVTAKGYTFASQTIDTRNLAKSKTVNQDIKLQPLKANSSITLNNIFFEFDSSSISKESYFELTRVLELLKINQGMTIDIGSDTYNNHLSQSRAEAVVKFLTGKGIDKTRMTAKGYGKKKPLVPNNSEENRAKNRRVEFTILKL
jgi:outer membrane protein OmpA-like peptidoglycan-associated protein